MEKYRTDRSKEYGGYYMLNSQKALAPKWSEVPRAYWQSKGLGCGGKKTQPNPYKWSKTTIAKMLAQQEYCGDIINFKTYSKTFRRQKISSVHYFRYTNLMKTKI